MQVDLAIAITLRAGTALLFAAGLTHKLWDLSAFRNVLSQYLRGFGIHRSGLASPLAAVVLVLEAAIVGACVWPGGGETAAVLATGTLLLYAGAMAINILRGNTLLDCGCTWGSVRQPVGTGLVARNLVLSVLAAAMALPVAERSLGGIDIASVVLATLALALLYSAVNNLLVLGKPAWGNRS
jgi:hypothetical protein